jgi:ribosomal protein S18 acetylase RimI-like enzyme
MTESINKQLVLRMATAEDVDRLIPLFDIANHGDVSRILSEEAGEGGDWKALCRTHMTAPHSEIHHSKAVVAVVDGEVAGALFFFRFTPVSAPSDMTGIKPYMRPFIELRSLAPSGIFLRDMAVFPEFRGLRLATRMLDVAIDSGFSSGLKHAVAIVHETNTLLLDHYYKRGMTVMAKRQVLAHSHHSPESHWLLLQLDAPDPAATAAPAHIT